MKKGAIIGALVLVGVGVALGATDFRTDIAQATGLAQSVTVNNTSANPVPVNVTNTAVPVREQNLDAGNIKVHEQGTAKVAVQNFPPAQTPHTIRLGCLLGSDRNSCRATATVPTGQRFVIQTVSGHGSGAVAYFEIDLPDGRYYFEGRHVNSLDNGLETVLDTREVTLYAEPPFPIEFSAFLGPPAVASGTGGADISLSGYLVPAS